MSRTHVSKSFTIAAALFGALFSCGDAKLMGQEKSKNASSMIPIVENGKPRAVIAIPPGASAILRHAAQALQTEIHRRTEAQPPIVSSGDIHGADGVVYLGSQDTDASVVSAVKELGLSPASANSPGLEGFVLASGRGRIVVNGSDDLGTFHGVGWLLRRMEFRDGAAFVADGMNVRTSPAMRMRRIRFGDHFGYVNCEVEGFKAIWSDYIGWGLSGATFRCDPAHQGDPDKSYLGRYLWDRFSKLAALAISMGLEVVPLSQTNLVWKDGRWSPESIPDFQELHYLCPDKDPVSVNPKFPRAMELLVESRKWYFENMAWGERIDYHLFSGWDSGGCNDPEVQPWSVTYAILVDKFFPFIESVNPDAKGILGMHAVPEVDKLAEKLDSGWDPAWLYGIEFRDNQIKDAPRFPKKYKRFYFPTFTTTEKGQYQAIGANPKPRMCEKRFRECLEFGVVDGFGCYSEGTHDFINQIVFLQLAWDPSTDADRIVGELCEFYFGREAAPLVKQAIWLMEDESMVSSASPKTDPRVQELIASAETLMPGWAKSSRQWAMVKGRARVDRTWQRQADLLPDFEAHFQRYLALLKKPGPKVSQAAETEELKSYFKSVVDNAREMIDAYRTMDKDGFGVQGGSQQEPEWPFACWQDAREALTALENWQDAERLEAPPQPCIAYVDHQAKICLFEWGGMTRKSGQSPLNRPMQTGETAGDAQLVMADVKGDGLERIVYLGPDGSLYSWCPLRKRELLAKGGFLTGPLACGDIDGDGRKEVAALVKTESGRHSLAAVSGDGSSRNYEASPAGLASQEVPPFLWKNEKPVLSRAVNLDSEPRMVMADMNGDGRDEIICADRNRNNRLVVLDGNGARIGMGPESPAGALAGGDLDGDGQAEVVYMDRLGRCAVYSLKYMTVLFEEEVKPMFVSTVAIARLGPDPCATVVYADSQGWIRAIGLTGPSQRLSTLSGSVAVGPGMVVGDFDGDDRQDVGYLRRRLDFHLPLSSIAFVNPDGVVCLGRGGRSKPAPFGPRASGLLRFR